MSYYNLKQGLPLRHCISQTLPHELLFFGKFLSSIFNYNRITSCHCCRLLDSWDPGPWSWHSEHRNSWKCIAIAVSPPSIIHEKLLKYYWNIWFRKSVLKWQNSNLQLRKGNYFPLIKSDTTVQIQQCYCFLNDAIWGEILKTINVHIQVIQLCHQWAI